MSDLSQEKQGEIRLHLMTAQVMLSNLIVGVRDAGADENIVLINPVDMVQRLEQIQKDILISRNIIEGKE